MIFALTCTTLASAAALPFALRFAGAVQTIIRSL